jgi:hypothetical protein
MARTTKEDRFQMNTSSLRLITPSDDEGEVGYNSSFSVEVVVYQERWRCESVQCVLPQKMWSQRQQMTIVSRICRPSLSSLYPPLS